jgi:hypothetical protein
MAVSFSPDIIVFTIVERDLVGALSMLEPPQASLLIGEE